MKLRPGRILEGKYRIDHGLDLSGIQNKGAAVANVVVEFDYPMPGPIEVAAGYNGAIRVQRRF